MKQLTRIQNQLKSQTLEGKLVLVTGCGYKPVRHRFHDPVNGEESHDAIFDKQGNEYKLNIGAASAAVLARAGADVRMVSTSPDKLQLIKDNIDSLIDSSLTYTAKDMMSRDEIDSLVESLPANKEIYWFQSVGLGAGSYTVENDNPYRLYMDVPKELIRAEQNVVLATHDLAQAMNPIFKEQAETRIGLVTSMSGKRAYTRGTAHATAKFGMEGHAKSLKQELYKDNAYVTLLGAGGIDTGMYDGDAVQHAVLDIQNEFNGPWTDTIRLAPPSAMGQSALYAFSTPAHVIRIDVVAKSQIPHELS